LFNTKAAALINHKHFNKNEIE